ncbi:MAG: 4-oxalomesaconate tautomerase [Rhodospirillales bacterium]|nr:4-oxalomesaconate tautomerase [Rhodospirillales bacterium]
MQTALPCVLMRAGTSRGPFFLAADLPADPPTRDAVLLAAMGSAHPLQVDGLGGGNPLTSKVAIVSPSAHPDADVDYLFAQVAVDRQVVDTAPNCGNMLAGVGPFAIEAGLVAARAAVTTVRVRNVNTGALVEARVQTPGGTVTYEGTAAIPGVAGTAAPIELRFRRIAGARTGRLFPTGRRQESLDGVPATLIDCATPVMLLPAAALGVDAGACPAVIEADRALMDRIEALRLAAGRRMGLGDVRASVLPKPVLLGPAADATLAARYFTPHTVHRAMAVTGGLAIAAAARLAGTVAAELAAPGDAVRLRHPAGVLDVALEVAGEEVAWAGVVRTARRLFEGKVLVPARIWPGREAADRRRERPLPAAA